MSSREIIVYTVSQKFVSLQRQTEGPNEGAFKDSDLAKYLMDAFVSHSLFYSI